MTAGGATQPLAPHREVLFQSAPADDGGRCEAGDIKLIVPNGFNPRPPMTAGGAVIACSNIEQRRVSIRARR